MAKRARLEKFLVLCIKDGRMFCMQWGRGKEIFSCIEQKEKRMLE
jgi:hypothetical protein